jgi:predicted nucleic acid-binding protein
VKLVVEEPESAALRNVLAGDPDQLASALVEVEVVRAVRRAVPELAAHAERVVAQIAVVEISDAIRARARRLEPASVRSLDALHLATAMEIGDDLDALLTYDVRMSRAAADLGLRVLAPS